MPLSLEFQSFRLMFISALLCLVFTEDDFTEADDVQPAASEDNQSTKEENLNKKVSNFIIFVTWVSARRSLATLEKS